jgi:sterol desaturase/sphingolipid hydroxylase (fatty acid hydroxylase superfamily)
MDFLKSLPNVAYIASPMYIAFIAMEAYAISKGAAHGKYERKDAITSIVMGAGSVLINTFIAILGMGAVAAAYEVRLFDFEQNLWALAICFVAEDLRFYWSHRLQHRSRWFWACHVIHHSSEHYNLSTALRQPWTSVISGLAFLWVPLALIGFHPLLIAFCFALNLIYQFFLHTETITRFPDWFEAVMNTPSHHRVHHGANPRYLDANYAGVFIIWDKMFGTFVPEQDKDPSRYGLVVNIGTFNPLRVAFGEYLRIARDCFQPGLSFHECAAYVFAPPGWSHDGSRKDSLAIKRDYLREHPIEAGEPGLPSNLLVAA